MTQDETLRADQLAPHSMEAEEAVIGAVLVNPMCYPDVADLRADQFFVVRHAWIWEAITDLKTEADIVTIGEHLKARGRLDETGGRAYLAALNRQVPSALNVESYAREVQKLALRRRLIDAAARIARAAHSEDTPIEDVLALSEGAVREVLDDGAGENRDDPGAWAAAEYDRVAQWVAQPGVMRGFPCGIAPIDSRLGGFKTRHLHWVAGRPGMGKSTLLSQMAWGFAREGTPTLVFSLEMTGEELRRWMLAQITGVSAKRIEEGRITEAEHARVVEGIGVLRDRLAVFVEEPSGPSIPRLRSIARRYQRDHGVRVVMIDTLNNVREFGDDRDKANLNAQVTRISKVMQAWAKEDDVALFAAVQMNRAATQRQDKRPTLSDLRESGSLEQAAHVVIGLHREGYYDEAADQSVAEILYLKARMGDAAGKRTKLRWRGEWPGFEVNEEKVVQLGDLSARRTNGKALHAHNVPDEEDLF